MDLIFWYWMIFIIAVIAILGADSIGWDHWDD